MVDIKPFGENFEKDKFVGFYFGKYTNNAQCFTIQKSENSEISTKECEEISFNTKQIIEMTVNFEDSEIEIYQYIWDLDQNSWEKSYVGGFYGIEQDLKQKSFYPVVWVENVSLWKSVINPWCDW